MRTLNKRRAAKPAVYFWSSASPGAGRATTYNRRLIPSPCDGKANRYSVGVAACAADMRCSRDRVPMCIEAIVWFVKSFCSCSQLSQCSESCVQVKMRAGLHVFPSVCDRSHTCEFHRCGAHLNACASAARVSAHHGATSSTRLFSARPASVAFEPTGASNPTPAVRSRGCAIRKLFTSSAATASARRFERSRLYS